MQNNNVGNEFKAVAQDVMQLGARCVQAGRVWLTERRNEMTNRNDESRHDEAARKQRHQAPQSYGGYSGRQPGEGYGDSSGYGNPDSDSYGSGYRAPPYVVPGGTQPRYAEARPRSYRGVGPKNYTRSDERITEELCERLTDDHDIDASGIEVKVAQGTATLEGTVSQRWMKHRAEDVADSCSGVRTVENRIKVQSSGPAYGASGSADVGSSASGTAGASQTASPTTPPAGGSKSGPSHGAN